MQELNMHVIEIFEKGKVLEIPAHWDECSIEQLNSMLKYAFQVSVGKLSYGEFRLQVFCLLTGFQVAPKYQYHNRLGLSDAINENLYKLSAELCSWCFLESGSKQDFKVQLNYTSIRNPFPCIEISGKHCTGPDDLLGNLTFAEFRNGLSIMQDYFQCIQNEEIAEAEGLLNTFISLLYKSEDCTKVELYIKQAILIWFCYCIHFIQSEPIVIDGNELDIFLLFPKNDSPSNQTKQSLGWSGLLFEVAESGIFGNVEAADQTNLFQILAFLYKKYLDNKKLKK
ncbi:hypothetical protein J5U18_12750 [Sphingobacteriaceae bacterium WQ 2009]|uniref:Uncharacterized protein n=1 Tax=Rhinopithecimicrobium faecis TaxID=2820698 RepID=A0A8T4HBC6_9SPHI|nr:hypothetical protein [Sphingobacteriaceae bacterium WQ 2009]